MSAKKEFQVKHDRWPRARGFTEKELRHGFRNMDAEGFAHVLKRIRAQPLQWLRFDGYHVVVRKWN